MILIASRQGEGLVFLFFFWGGKEARRWGEGRGDRVVPGEDVLRTLHVSLLLRVPRTLPPSRGCQFIYNVLLYYMVLSQSVPFVGVPRPLASGKF